MAKDSRNDERTTPPIIVRGVKWTLWCRSFSATVRVSELIVRVAGKYPPARCCSSYTVSGAKELGS